MTPLPEMLDAVQKITRGKVNLFRSSNDNDNPLATIRSRRHPFVGEAIGANTATTGRLVNTACNHRETMKSDLADHNFAGAPEGWAAHPWVSRVVEGVTGVSLNPSRFISPRREGRRRRSRTRHSPACGPRNGAGHAR